MLLEATFHFSSLSGIQSLTVNLADIGEKSFETAKIFCALVDGNVDRLINLDKTKCILGRHLGREGFKQ